MQRVIRRSVLLVASVGCAVIALPIGAAVPADATRTVYISAADSIGAPVLDLTAAELLVRESGKACQIASLTAATAPIDLAVLVDDAGTGVFRAGLASLVQKLYGHAHFSISRNNGNRFVDVLDSAADAPAILRALGDVGPSNAGNGNALWLLNEAIKDSSTQLAKRHASRPVILVLTVWGGGDGSGDVLEHLRQSGAALNVVTSGPPRSVLSAFDDVAKPSGGRVETALRSFDAVSATTKIADTLLHQYELTYTLPAGSATSDRLRVSTTRHGVSLIAPTRLPK